MTNTHITIGGHKVSAGKVYSTSEVRTGDVWIDGKPIYRRTFEIKNADWTTSTSSSRYNRLYDTNIGEDIRVCKTTGWFRANVSGAIRNIAFGSTLPASNLDVTYGSTVEFTEVTNILSINFFCSTTFNTNVSSVSAYITVEYIKTAD